MNEPVALPPAAREVLKRCFGYEGFRAGQAEIIAALLAGRDSLGVMPTGAGKSLCYQVPALLLPGLTLVVSPLISLMRDQVAALRQSGVSAACLASSLSPAEYAAAVRNALAGAYKIVYVAPERLLRDDTLRIAGSVGLSLLAVDEAHCVSQWGHDFRPSYLGVREFVRLLPRRPPVAAFTATATEKVRGDIIESLALRDPYTLAVGIDRPNLYFEVQVPADKMDALLAYLRRNGGKSGIVYCATRKTVEKVAARLGREGFAATRYHAGLSGEERKRNQDDFLYDRKTVMAATNAFGMGIDKPNVSFVVHYNMPKNIESYCQEAGRAGRDGERADCVLLYSGKDVRLNRFLIENSGSGRGDGGKSPDSTAAEAQKQRSLELLKQMTFYSTTTDCLRAFILRYFGETAPGYCGKCSNCAAHFEPSDVTLDAQKIVSCVYRAAERGLSFGKAALADILRGSRNAKLLEARLDTLSTYGIMKDASAKRLRAVTDRLVERGYLLLDGAEYPVLKWSAKTREILDRERPLRLEMMLPREEAIQGARETFHAEAGGEIDAELLSRLKKLRKRVAGDANVPAYIVFADATLKDMCRKLPQTKARFLEVPGVGKVKMEQYGDRFTAEIRDFLESGAH
ncbi:DNA helicase RecQ [Treponema endosymbiont of Eucomonympha sp.]|uniref:DNA helicase RecQ n=2 Tax=Treponema endosymbiont of Eucomonympha sp. TaxID=1580831 RepID=UPI000750C825|nr:DNA helicase RecQ [Treponema endosymbiont of Eucomonympha sp.]